MNLLFSLPQSKIGSEVPIFASSLVRGSLFLPCGQHNCQLSTINHRVCGFRTVEDAGPYNIELSTLNYQLKTPGSVCYRGFC